MAFCKGIPERDQKGVCLVLFASLGPRFSWMLCCFPHSLVFYSKVLALL